MASPNVSFTQIPGNLLRPQVAIEENTSNAIQGLSPLNDKVCLIAQQLTTGTATPKTINRITDDGQAALLYGTGSAAHLMAKAALQANPYCQLYMEGAYDPAGTKAAGSVNLYGTATVAGIVNCWVGDQLAQASVAVGDNGAMVAAKLLTAVNNISAALPVTDASSAGRVTFTARHYGSLGNYIGVAATTSSDIGVDATNCTGGTGDLDLGAYDTSTSVLYAQSAAGMTILGLQNNDSVALGKVKTLLDYVSNPIEQRSMTAAFAATDSVCTMAAMNTLCGTTENHGRLTGAYLSYNKSAGTPTQQARTEAWKLAAMYASVLGSSSDPAVPYDGLTLPTAAAPAVIDRFTKTEQETMLAAGVVPLAVLSAEQVAIVRAVSTYTTNSVGSPDVTLRDINTIRTLDYVRDQVRQRLLARFIRSKLSTRTPIAVRSQTLDVLSILESLEIVQNVARYAPGVICERDTQDPTRIDIKIPCNIVSGLHVIAGVLELIL